MTSGTDKIANVSSDEVLNDDPEVTAKLKELADLLNKNGEALEVQTGAGVKSFFGLAQTCC